MKFFNFGLEQKLGQHSSVEFHGDSDGNGKWFQSPETKAVKFGKFSSKNAANSDFLKNARIIRWFKISIRAVKFG